MRYKVGDCVKVPSTPWPVGRVTAVHASTKSYTVLFADGKSGLHHEEHLEPALPSLIESDPVSHPQHYLQHPSGLEIIDITRHHGYCIGNALKYLFRHEHKGNPVEDLRKAIAYIEFAIEDLEKPA